MASSSSLVVSRILSIKYDNGGIAVEYNGDFAMVFMSRAVIGWICSSLPAGNRRWNYKHCYDMLLRKTVEKVQQPFCMPCLLKRVLQGQNFASRRTGLDSNTKEQPFNARLAAATQLRQTYIILYYDLRRRIKMKYIQYTVYISLEYLPCVQYISRTIHTSYMSQEGRSKDGISGFSKLTTFSSCHPCWSFSSRSATKWLAKRRSTKCVCRGAMLAKASQKWMESGQTLIIWKWWSGWLLVRFPLVPFV